MVEKMIFLFCGAKEKAAREKLVVKFRKFTGGQSGHHLPMDGRAACYRRSFAKNEDVTFDTPSPGQVFFVIKI
ncbi:MAG: hypothetical protein LBB84_00230 [Tannerellaceae bacterium]|jgi:hypothetical protein|nr:hypothetical protein [Tannerellaceae bacterium]